MTVAHLVSAPDRDRRFGRFAIACAVATVTLFLITAVVAPPAQRPGLLGITALSGMTVVLAAALLSRGFSLRLLTLAGLVLMVLGIGAGALLLDGLDGAAVMPLAGAVIALPALRGRRLLAMFALGFGASMLGETAAYVSGGMTHLAGLVEVPLALLESAVMLAFTYGLVWWVGDRWWRAHEEAGRALASQRRLLDVNERLLSTLDPEGVLNLIADSLKSVVAYDNLTIYRVDHAARLLRPFLARDRFATLIMDSTFPFDRGITGWVVAHGEAQCVNDAHRDPRTTVIPGTPPEAESLIVVPLFVGGTIAGTLNVGRMGESEAHFKPEEFELARLFAGQASIALQNAEAHRAVQARAETDALTGLLNRGEFDARLAALILDPRARPLALVMLDLDDFKEYNDRHGHPAGDALLRATAGAIGDAVRDGDQCFRYGGDEFAILLPQTAEPGATHVADRVRGSVARVAAGEGCGVTASVGLACTASGPLGPRGSVGPGDLVTCADAALYRAKQAGGDRVEVAGEDCHAMPSLVGSHGMSQRGHADRSGDISSVA